MFSDWTGVNEIDVKVDLKVDELLKNFGGAELALLVAKEVYSVRCNLSGRSYTRFVRFWSMVIYKLDKMIK